MKPYTIESALRDFKNNTLSCRALTEKAAAAFEEDAKSAFPLNAFLDIYPDAAQTAQKCDDERTKAASSGTLDTLLAQKP